MASQVNSRATRPEHMPNDSPAFWPEGFEQHKLNRLLELRAVIDAMRCAEATQDGLFTRIAACERNHLS
jgi:hypothetical protein